MKKTESAEQARVMKECGGLPNVRLFRNNVGVAMLKDGRWVRFGLARGSADLIGWKSVAITTAMVGKRVAVFCSLEVKGAKGRATPEQIIWERAVASAGGLAGIVKSPDEAMKVLASLQEGPHIPTNENENINPARNDGRRPAGRSGEVCRKVPPP